ncbi:MAG: response regulator [Geobacter sp.]|nr:response regulator [Geobacter sp.]
MNQPAALLVDDEPAVLAAFSLILEQDGYLVRQAASTAAALQILDDYPCDIAIVDVQLGVGTGVDLLKLLRLCNPLLQVVLITGRPEIETAAEAIRLGACNYLTKPIQPNELLNAARNALNAKRLAEEADRHRADLEAIFRSLSDGILMLDAAGALQHANEAAARICACLSRQVTHSEVCMHLPCDGACRQLIQESLATGLPGKRERIRCKMPQKQEQVVTITTSPIRDHADRCTGIVVVLRDETRIDQLEGQLHTRKGFGRMIGASLPMQRLYSKIEALADVPSTVLIQGESGTGKELVAEALHSFGSRRGKAFVKVNCSALSDALLESELFGHVKGAFTGAVTNKAGRFQKADGGTIFLDEIGDISPAMQIRLLRVLQEREFEQVGDSTTIKVDVRVLAATHQDLTELVRQGKFREDLYYRLHVIKLSVPPLRERMEDLPLLIELFLERYSLLFRKTISGISDAAMALLRAHTWPGNVRELQHVLEHACVLSCSSLIDTDLLPLDLTTPQARQLPPESAAAGAEPLPSSLAGQIAEALIKSGGNKSKAAHLLGISRRTIYRHLENLPTD